MDADAVRRFYDDPRRRYHSWRHVRAVCACLRRWLGPELPFPLEAAALWHDAIYDPTRSDNEEASAEACAQHLDACGISAGEIATAAALIRATRHHEAPPDDRDAIALIDADLWILGAPERTYRRYARLIRQEYAHIPDQIYRSGRSTVLSTFLARPLLYRGGWPGVTRREQRARQNLVREVASLQ